MYSILRPTNATEELNAGTQVTVAGDFLAVGTKLGVLLYFQESPNHWIEIADWRDLYFDAIAIYETGRWVVGLSFSISKSN